MPDSSTTPYTHCAARRYHRGQPTYYVRLSYRERQAILLAIRDKVYSRPAAFARLSGIASPHTLAMRLKRSLELGVYRILVSPLVLPPSHSVYDDLGSCLFSYTPPEVRESPTATTPDPTPTSSPDTPMADATVRTALARILQHLYDTGHLTVSALPRALLNRAQRDAFRDFANNLLLANPAED